MRMLKRVVVAAAITLLVIGSAAIALAQGSGSTPATNEPGVETEVQFIGDPPGNDQTGEWEGEHDYEE